MLTIGPIVDLNTVEVYNLNTIVLLAMHELRFRVVIVIFTNILYDCIR